MKVANSNSVVGSETDKELALTPNRFRVKLHNSGFNHLFTTGPLLMALFLFLMTGCKKSDDDNVAANYLTTTVTNQLQGPMGMVIDSKGNIWVAESGTGHNDGKIVVVQSSDSTVKDAVINLASIPNAVDSELEGPSHMLLDGNNLYVLAGDDLYTIDVGNFTPGNAAIDASTITPEDIGSYVRSLNIVTPNDSHPYNLIKGPDGKIYIVDAGANALLRRDGAGSYAVVATFPTFPNPTQVGPPQIQSVPTGIMYDGNNFLVTTLTGFPFPENAAKIYQVSLSGAVSVWKEGFTALVDIVPGNSNDPLVLQIGMPGGGEFLPNSGVLRSATQDSLITGLNMPSALIQANSSTWYATSLTGSLLKITKE